MIVFLVESVFSFSFFPYFLVFFYKSSPQSWEFIKEIFFTVKERKHAFGQGKKVRLKKKKRKRNTNFTYLRKKKANTNTFDREKQRNNAVDQEKKFKFSNLPFFFYKFPPQSRDSVRRPLIGRNVLTEGQSGNRLFEFYCPN